MSDQLSTSFARNTSLIHYGVEFVVIGGMAFYFSKRCSSLEEQIHHLEEKNKTLEERLNRHEELLRRMLAPQSQEAPHPPKTSRKPKTKKNRNNDRGHNHISEKKKDDTTHKKDESHSGDDVLEIESETDLDDMIRDELPN